MIYTGILNLQAEVIPDNGVTLSVTPESVCLHESDDYQNVIVRIRVVDGAEIVQYGEDADQFNVTDIIADNTLMSYRKLTGSAAADHGCECCHYISILPNKVFDTDLPYIITYKGVQYHYSLKISMLGKAENLMIADADDDMIPIPVINAGVAYGLEKNVHISCYYGSKLITEGLTYTVPETDVSKVEVYGAGPDFTIEAMSGGDWTNKEKETVTIKVQHELYGTATARISLVPVFPGKDSLIYSLQTSHSAFPFKRDDYGNIIGAYQLKVNIVEHNGTSQKVHTIIPDDSNLKVACGYDGDIKPISNLLAEIDIDAASAVDKRMYVVTLWEGEPNVGKLLDRETIPFVYDGQKGDPGEQGIQGLQGLQGEQGEQGIPGKNGTSQYFHVKYSDDGGVTFTGNHGEDVGIFIGTKVDDIPNDNQDPAYYDWHRLEGIQGPQGEQGIPGVGIDGKTSYLHIKYSNDGGKTFTPAMGDLAAGETPGDWIGQYVDFTKEDSKIPSDYKWNDTRGEKGDQGDKGDQGEPGENGQDGKTPKPNLLHATSLKSFGTHPEKWNVRIAAKHKTYESGTAVFEEVDGGLNQTKYLHVEISDGLEPEYVDLLQQNIINDKVRKVRKNTWYTLSFYVRGKVSVYIYSTSSHSTSVVQPDALVDGKPVRLKSNGNVSFIDSYGTEWVKHTITFQTTEFDTTAQILFRMFTSSAQFVGTNLLKLDLCCIKLEGGKEDTPWRNSERDARGASPSYPIWADGETFFSGEDGEDVYSVCEYHAESDGNPVYWLCTKSHKAVMGVNDPITCIQQTPNLPYWKRADKQDFILAGKIASDRIDTNTLVAKRFYSENEDKNRRVQIQNGLIEIFGSGEHSNIRIGLDEDGCAILEFYNKDGVFQYGLGPSQIDSSNHTRHQRWDKIRLLYLDTTDMGTAVLSQKWRTDFVSGDLYYRYISAINVAGDNQDPDNDQRIFKSMITSETNKVNGIFVNDGPKMMAMVDQTGQPIIGDIHSNNPAIGVGTVYMRTLLKYRDGIIVSRQNVYWTDSFTNL